MKFAFFDLDGVLADDRHRVPLYLSGDFVGYFSPENVAKDGVWEEGRQKVAEYMEAGYSIGYLTGRRDVMRTSTRAWLEANGFPTSPLLMRTSAFYEMRLADFKVEAMRSLISYPRYDTVVLLDDDPEVIKAVQTAYGEDAAVHCTWYIKESGMVKEAQA